MILTLEKFLREILIHSPTILHSMMMFFISAEYLFLFHRYLYHFLPFLIPGNYLPVIIPPFLPPQYRFVHDDVLPSFLPPTPPFWNFYRAIPTGTCHYLEYISPRFLHFTILHSDACFCRAVTDILFYILLCLGGNLIHFYILDCSFLFYHFISCLYHFYHFDCSVFVDYISGYQIYLPGRPGNFCSYHSTFYHLNGREYKFLLRCYISF